MISSLHIEGFKSLEKVSVSFPSLTVLFGPNAAGKSNLLDAAQVLSRLGTSRTISDALSEPIRGHAVEAFTFGKDGLPGLLSREESRFMLEADLNIGKDRFRYRVEIAIHPKSGGLTIKDEYLSELKKTGEEKRSPSILKVSEQLRIRRKSKPGHPRYEQLGLNHTQLSDPRLSGVEYRAIEKCRKELVGWRMYYPDPRVGMRSAKPPSDVVDIGVLGEDIAPFLYRLRAEYPRNFEAVRRALRSVVPGVEDFDVDLDKRRGTLDIQIRQDGTDYSSRIISEGTLRVLALCSVAANPWGGSLLAFEEPENGVHPRRIELIAQLLLSIARDQKRQVIVTTHSPLFCDSVLRASRSKPGEIALLNVRRGKKGTEVFPFDVTGTLFKESEIAKALAAEGEDTLFEGLMMRGMLGG